MATLPSVFERVKPSVKPIGGAVTLAHAKGGTETTNDEAVLLVDIADEQIGVV